VSPDSTKVLHTRSISKEELLLGWEFWIPISLFFILSATSFYIGLTTKDKKENPAVLFVCGFLFFSICFGSICYAVLRRREKQGVRIQLLREKNKHWQTLFLPCSRVLQNCVLAGSFVLALLLMALLSRLKVSDFDFGRGVVATVVFWILFGYFLLSRFGVAPGIYFVPEGIYWRSFFGPNCFIQWESINESDLFIKPRERDPNPVANLIRRKIPNRNQVFGIRVDPQNIQSNSRDRKRLLASAKQFHFHLMIEREILAVPLPLAAAIVAHYRAHPEHRCEIGSTEGLARIRELADTTGSSLSEAHG
jgi:hypothetical protein